MPTFRKNERLCGKTNFDTLFAEGKKSFLHPFKVYVLKVDNFENACKIAIIVSKKISKIAPIRNRLRRQIKEAYRLEKDNLLTNLKLHNKSIHLAVVYIGKQNENFDVIHEKIKLILSRLSSDSDK